MKKKKEYNLWGKLRSAVRAVWMYSPQHREALAKAKQKDPEQGYFFECLICMRQWPMPMASIDHQPACGRFDNWTDFTKFCVQLFEGPTRVICKICHKKITSEQRRKK